MNNNISGSTRIVNLIISNSCKPTGLQLKLLDLAGELNSYFLSLLGVLYPLAAIESTLTLLALCIIRGWRNPARSYYYVIAVANFIAVFFSDWSTFLVACHSWATRWFPNGTRIVATLHWELYWSPLCALFKIVTDSILLPKLWLLVLFCVHRTWIVLDPLRAPVLKRIFRPALVIGLPIGITVFYIPQLWQSYIAEGWCFTEKSLKL